MFRLLSCVSTLIAAVLLTGCGGDSPSSPSQNRIPNYGGNWSGTYTITGCTQSGGVAAANLCGSLGSTAPYQFSLSQSQRNVNGSFSLGNIQFPSTGGTVAQDGSLSLEATTQSSGITVIVRWALTLPATALAGTITQNWQHNTLSGQANVAGSINTAIRSAATAPALIVAPRTLEEAIRAIQQP